MVAWTSGAIEAFDGKAEGIKSKRVIAPMGDGGGEIG